MSLETISVLLGKLYIIVYRIGEQRLLATCVMNTDVSTIMPDGKPGAAIRPDDGIHRLPKHIEQDSDGNIKEIFF